MLTLEFYDPRASENARDVREIERLLLKEEEIKIKEFLEGLLKRRNGCLYEKFKIRNELRGRENESRKYQG